MSPPRMKPPNDNHITTTYLERKLKDFAYNEK